MYTFLLNFYTFSSIAACILPALCPTLRPLFPPSCSFSFVCCATHLRRVLFLLFPDIRCRITSPTRSVSSAPRDHVITRSPDHVLSFDVSKSRSLAVTFVSYSGYYPLSVNYVRIVFGHTTKGSLCSPSILAISGVYLRLFHLVFLYVVETKRDDL